MTKRKAKKPKQKARKMTKRKAKKPKRKAKKPKPKERKLRRKVKKPKLKVKKPKLKAKKPKQKERKPPKRKAKKPAKKVKRRKIKERKRKPERRKEPNVAADVEVNDDAVDADVQAVAVVVEEDVKLSTIGSLTFHPLASPLCNGVLTIRRLRPALSLSLVGLRTVLSEPSNLAILPFHSSVSL